MQPAVDEVKEDGFRWWCSERHQLTQARSTKSVKPALNFARIVSVTTTFIIDHGAATHSPSPPSASTRISSGGMAPVRAQKLKSRSRIKSTTTDIKEGHAQSTFKSGFRVNEEVRKGLADREEFLQGMYSIFYWMYHILKPAGQTSGTRAAASQMAMEAGAAPDENMPIIALEDTNLPWVDEDYDEELEEAVAGISHAGGEMTDKARLWFERATRK